MQSLEEKARTTVREGTLEMEVGEYVDAIMLAFEDQASGADPRTARFTRQGKQAVLLAAGARAAGAVGAAADAAAVGKAPPPSEPARAGMGAGEGEGADAHDGSGDWAAGAAAEPPEAETVSVGTLEEYVRAMASFMVDGGIAAQLRALRRGLSQAVPLGALRMFTGQELCLLVNGEPRVDWDAATLRECVVTSGGLRRTSPLFKAFVNVLAGLGRKDRQAFLRFATGSPQLPMGGLRALRPLLKVAEQSRAQGSLVTAATCFHKINIPPLPDEAALRRQLLTSVRGAVSLMDRT